MILPIRKLPLWLFAFVLGLLTLLGVVSPGAEAAGPRCRRSSRRAP